jgi:hypothetical protein
MGMKRGWETQSFYQSKLLVASGIPGWNATNLLYRHQGEMLRFLCRLINLITPKKWELVESTDVKKLRPTFIVHQFHHRHHRERCPDTFYVVFAFHPVFCESHFVVHVRLGSALQDSTPRAPQGAEQIYASTFLHSDMWEGGL